MDAWREETEPVALGLLGLKPWEFDRCTVGEVELMITGARDRVEHLRDLLGWHALRTTEYPEGTQLDGVLGRAPFPVDPRWRKKPTDDDEDGAPDPYAEDLIDDARTIAQQYEQGGMAKTGRLTPEEFAKAQAESRAR